MSDRDDLVRRAQQLREFEPQAYAEFVPLAIALADAIGVDNQIRLDERLERTGRRQVPAQDFISDGTEKPRGGTYWAVKGGYKVQFGVVTSFYSEYTASVRAIAPILERREDSKQWKPTFEDPQGWAAFARDEPRLSIWLSRIVDQRTEIAANMQARGELSSIMADLDPIAQRALLRSAAAIRDASPAYKAELGQRVDLMKLNSPRIQPLDAGPDL